MELSKIVMGVMGLVIGAIILATLLIPVVTDVSTTEDVLTNGGYYRMDKIQDEEVVIEWDHTEPKQITVNGDVLSLDSVPTNRITTLAVTDSMLVRFAPISSNTLVQSYSSAGYLGASVTDGTDMTITISEGSISVDNGVTTITKTFTEGYYASNVGPWIMKENDAPAYVHESDSIIILAGSTTVGTKAVGVFGQGTIEDGLDIISIPTDSTETVATYGDVTFTYTGASEYVDIVKLTKCNFDMTVGADTVDATYSYFLVPYEVTAERAQHMDAGQIAIMAIVPLMCMVALVMVAVRMISGRSD